MKLNKVEDESFNSKMTPDKASDNHNAQQFEGIPNALDFVPYAKIYYSLVEKSVSQLFGPNATLLQATRAMNRHGNLIFFKWFPELFNTTPEELKHFYRPRFSFAGNNKYADYLHGLTHIRSRSEHTNLGEALVVPDNYYTLGIKYKSYMNTNKDKAIHECLKSPYEEFDLSNSQFDIKKVYLMNVRFLTYQYQRPSMRFYELIYTDGNFKKDFPLEKLSQNFLYQPMNSYEKRLSYNVIRTVYLDEKFKYISSLQKSFIHTPIHISAKEHYSLVFTNKEEDYWIEQIHNCFVQNGKDKLITIINTTHNKSDISKKIASETIKSLEYIN